MDRSRTGLSGALAVAGLGLFLFLVSAVHHLVIETATIGEWRGPVIAFLLDGTPPLALVYAGYWLSGTDLDHPYGRRIFLWTLAGVLLVPGTVGLTILVRQFEGRVVSEPVFVLLQTAGVGGLAGFAVGLSNARARRDADRTERARHALGFVNRLLRHDLRNDMTVIRGKASLVADAADSEDEQLREWASDITETTDQMEDLVESAGALAEALVEEPADERIDLTDVVEEVTDRADATYAADIVTDLPDTAVVVGNDALTSVVSNLVENAVEHGTGTGADGPAVSNLTVEASVSVEEDADRARLRVADDGVGVPDEEKADIFEPRAGTGHGGGLHLVSALVERFGGSIRVADNEPRGTVFEVELPLADGTS